MEGVALLRAFAGGYDREFTLARFDEIRELPLPDDSVDVIVCAIALVHLADIEGPFHEFARVLRAGGHLVVSDQCGLIGNIGFPVVFEGSELGRPEGELGYILVYLRSASEYLAAALPLGFRVLRCEEPRVPWPILDEQGRTIHDGQRLPSLTWRLRGTSLGPTLTVL